MSLSIYVNMTLDEFNFGSLVFAATDFVGLVSFGLGVGAQFGILNWFVGTSLDTQCSSSDRCIQTIRSPRGSIIKTQDLKTHTHTSKIQELYA